MRQMNLSTKQKQTLKLTEQTCDCPGEGGWGGMVWDGRLGLAGVNSCIWNG